MASSGKLSNGDPCIVNNIKQVEKAFGDVPAAYTQLIDLGTTHVFTNMLIQNELNREIAFKFFGGDEISVPDADCCHFSDFNHNDVIEYKYLVSAPTNGVIKITSW